MLIIHTFWTGEEPPIANACQESWKRFLPPHQKIIHKDEPKYKPKNYYDLIPAMKADIIRLNALYEFGGLWLDYTIQFLQKFNPDTTQFAMPKMWHDSYEYWMITGPPKCENVLKWLIQTIKAFENLPNKIYETSTDNIYFLCGQSLSFLINTKQIESPHVLYVGRVMPLLVIPFQLPFDRRLLIKYTSLGRRIRQRWFVIILILIFILTFFLFSLFSACVRNSGPILVNFSD